MIDDDELSEADVTRSVDAKDPPGRPATEKDSEVVYKDRMAESVRNYHREKKD